MPALRELAEKHHVPFYSSDGKTGETLLKTELAPMFGARNLEVLSWEGFNILGGDDGRVLIADPSHKRSRLTSKAGVVGKALGYEPHASVASSTFRRDFVPFRASSAPRGACSSSGKGATRSWPRRSSLTWCVSLSSSSTRKP